MDVCSISPAEKTGLETKLRSNLQWTLIFDLPHRVSADHSSGLWFACTACPPASDSPTPYLWGPSLPTVSIVEEEGLEVGVPQLTLDLIPCQYFPLIHHCVQVRCHEMHPACAWTLRDCGANRRARAVTGILWAGRGVSVTEAEQ